MIPVVASRTSRRLSGSLRRAGPAARVALLVVLAGGTGCSDTVVTTVDVDVVRVTPEQARIGMGSTLQFTAEVLDREAQPIRGMHVAWSTEDPTVAEVDGDGMVTPTGPGETVVQATADGKTGTATLVIARSGHITLERTSVGFTTAAGSSDPPPVDVGITNTGEEPLESLAVAVEYAAGQPTGWLETTLASPRTDTRVTLAPSLGALAEGTYYATVLITDPQADNSPATISVALDVRSGPPNEPSDLVATIVAGAVELSWSDNSAGESEFRVERRDPDATQFVQVGSVGTDVTSFTDGGVQPDRSYTYRVRACSAGGCSGASGEATALTPPNPPSGFSASPESSTEILLTWTDNSVTETEVRIERRQGGGTFAEVGSAGTDATTFRDSGLEPSATYEYRALACNAGGCSEPSEVAQATTSNLPVPAAPSSLQIAAETADSIRLSWLDNSDDETGFEIQRRAPGESSFSQLQVVGANTTRYTDASVETDARYDYRVRACAEGGCSAFTAEVTAQTPPAPPTSVGAVALSPSEVRVTWTDPNSSTTVILLERRVGGGVFQEIQQLSPGTTSFDDQGLAPETSYTYRLRACNDAGCSLYSSEAGAQTEPEPIPDPPSDLRLDVVDGGTNIQLSWQDNSDDEARFEIERKDPGSANYAKIAETGADVNSYLDDSVSEDATYSYRVTACASGGCSAYTNEVSETTRPSAPSGLQAVTDPNNPDTEITVSWVDNADTEIAFELERKTESDASYARIARLDPNAVTYSDQNLTPETTYSYRVRTCNDTGCSPYSNTDAATTEAPPPPAAPSNLRATAVSDTYVDLAWDDNSDDEENFEIWRKTGSGGSYSKILTPNSGETTARDRAVFPGTQYFYQIRACKAGDNCSTFSAELSVTTPTIPAPTELSAQISGEHVELAWKDNSGSETEFRILRGESSSSIELLDTTEANETKYRDKDVDEETTYYYVVQACNAKDECADSNMAVITVPDD